MQQQERKEVSLMAESDVVVAKYRALADLENKRHEQEISSLDAMQRAELAAIEAKCLEVNGAHVDDGGMFYMTCRNCGWCGEEVSEAQY